MLEHPVECALTGPIGFELHEQTFLIMGFHYKNLDFDAYLSQALRVLKRHKVSLIVSRLGQ